MRGNEKSSILAQLAKAPLETPCHAAAGDGGESLPGSLPAAYFRDAADVVAQAAEAIQAALQGAARVPLETMRLSAEVLEIAEQAAPLLNPAVISDVVVGAQLAQAALDSGAVNVEINLASMTDSSAVERLSHELELARAGAAGRLARVVAAGTSRFPKPADKR